MANRNLKQNLHKLLLPFLLLLIQLILILLLLLFLLLILPPPPPPPLPPPLVITLIDLLCGSASSSLPSFLLQPNRKIIGSKRFHRLENWLPTTTSLVYPCVQLSALFCISISEPVPLFSQFHSIHCKMYLFYHKHINWLKSTHRKNKYKFNPAFGDNMFSNRSLKV